MQQAAGLSPRTEHLLNEVDIQHDHSSEARAEPRSFTEESEDMLCGHASAYSACSACNRLPYLLLLIESCQCTGLSGLQP